MRVIFTGNICPIYSRLDCLKGVNVSPIMLLFVLQNLNDLEDFGKLFATFIRQYSNVAIENLEKFLAVTNVNNHYLFLMIFFKASTIECCRCTTAA